MKEKKPRKAPWQITNFPVNLRLQLAARARLRGISLSEMMIFIVKQWLNQEEQREELPVPKGVLDNDA